MISIIIIVKNDRRIEQLLVKLELLSKRKDIEVIVIDASNGTLDDIKKDFRKVSWNYYKSSKLNTTTIPEQRNKGVQIAKGDIIVFIDSDCIPHKNWLQELLKPIQREKEAIVAGKVLLSDNNSVHALEFEKNNNRKYLGEAPTMNLALKREVFDKVGLFDTNFQCGEDVDFLWRAIRIGYKIRYAPKAIIYHDLGSNIKEIKRMYVYGTARVDLYKKHQYRKKYFWGGESCKILYPLFFILLPISFIYPYYLALIFFLILNNKSINPFKLILYKTFYGAGILKELIMRTFNK